MWMDLTASVSKEMIDKVAAKGSGVPFGHLGTHFDVMNQEFPLELLMTSGLLFDVADIRGRDINVSDIDLSRIHPGDFVLFRTGFLEEAGYGSDRYLREHPQLSNELIDALLSSRVGIIGIDAAGIRRGSEHTPMDQHCADHGVFIVENLAQLEQLPLLERFAVYTFPIRFEGMSGLPCRVVAQASSEVLG